MSNNERKNFTPEESVTLANFLEHNLRMPIRPSADQEVGGSNLRSWFSLAILVLRRHPREWQ